jgi:UDP-glucose 4-epimerase|tara:strand:+ start:817 stop:1002 length:186 start_codon:yes stop_codon:yes gene_type:complete
MKEEYELSSNQQMKILLTGGTGYIGSHTAVVLAEASFEVVLFDNLSNSKRSVDWRRLPGSV